MNNASKGRCVTITPSDKNKCFQGFCEPLESYCIPFLHPYHCGMDLNAPESPCGDWLHAGENLRRLKTSGVYYVHARRGGKQFRRSLHTTDPKTARRKKDDFMRELDRLASAEAAQITFEELAARWLETERHTLKESSAHRRSVCVKAIAPAFLGLQIRNITARHCESWAVTRSKEIAAATFAKELETMRGAFGYATEQGLIIRDPSAKIKRPKIRNKPPAVPTREQFQNLVASIRSEPQGKGDEGALLVELLAYSGMRLNEALSLRWRDVNFSGGVFTVTGGVRGTKNAEQRTVPMSHEINALLLRLKRERGKAEPDALIVRTATARQCIQTACRNLGFPNFTHHSLRHYFGSCAIELKIDPTAASGWMGHKDGGGLLLKRYAHLRMSHSKEQMRNVFFGVKPPPGFSKTPAGIRTRHRNRRAPAPIPLGL